MAITVGVDTEDRLHAVETRSRLHLSLCGQLPHRQVYEWAWSDHLDDARERCELCARRVAQLGDLQ
jgi:hypothetical protein